MKERGAWLSAVLTIALIAAVIIGAAAVLSNRPQPVQIEIYPPPSTMTPAPTSTAGPITVYVTGAVGQPDTMITLPPGSRVQDAIESAGGFNPDADTTLVNLAAILRDGDQVHVPAQAAPEIVLATPQGGIVVHINTATPEELESLPGVGVSLAQAIFNFREANGPFHGFDDLDAVEGIGEGLIERWQLLIAFD
ncbi:MAG: helix-hairpin-helix domain-containing protein [Anaerolineae bacterium]|nr:helix-hairpin-helix domain-containing protein [Anaerolineae bacterium]